MRLEFRQAEQHTVRERQRAARQSGTGAARHHRHILAAAEQQYLAHLFFGLGQHDRQRHFAIGRQPVALEGLEVFLLEQHRLRRQNGLQLFDQFMFFHVLVAAKNIIP